jgi:hypothetical protein
MWTKLNAFTNTLSLWETNAFAGRKCWRHTWQQLLWRILDNGIGSLVQRQATEHEHTGYHSTQPKQSENAKEPSPLPDTQTEEAGWYLPRPNLTITQDTTLRTRARGGTVEALRCNPENRGFVGVFHWYNPSVRSMALGSTSCADCLEIWEPQPPGNLRASPGL